MPAQRFLIAPYNERSGLTSNVRPWQIPDNAFSQMENSYVFRGRVRKRPGTRYFGNDQLASRLRFDVGQYSITLPGGVNVGITTGAGNASGTVTFPLFQLGQRFVIGAETDTVISLTPGAQPMSSTGSSSTHTFNVSTGAYVFVAAPVSTQIYFFPNPAVTSGAGSMTGYLPYAPIPIGTMFSIGGVLFTVNVLGVPANLLVANGSATTATLNTTTGLFNFVGVLDSMGNPVAAASIYFYPALPVMGLLSVETSIVNEEPIVGFDTQYAYQYIGGAGWSRLSNEITAGASTWTGDNTNFFLGATWSGSDPSDLVFYVTNFNPNEPNYMRQYNPVTQYWDNFRPKVYSTPSDIYINSARIIVVFKNRLVLFNTWEGASTPGTNYVGRARWSTTKNPLDPLAFLATAAGDAALDASTTEAIIGAEFVKDRLIVFFERSTWEFVYTGNQAYPFAWQKINTELGAESTFSVVPFDKYALAIGNTGIHSCNGSNVERIDNKIPTEVFDIHDALSSTERVYGIRDYFIEVVYWSFASSQSSDGYSTDYNNKVLMYNYKADTWSLLDDSITCFGYYEPTSGVLWSSQTVLWSSDVLWGDASLQAYFRQTVAGNQEGYTFIMDSDAVTNAGVLQITNVSTVLGSVILNIIDHNFLDGSYIYINGAVWSDSSNGLNDMIYKVKIKLDGSGNADPDNIILDPSASYSGTYKGGGTVARVSQIMITTKEFNFFAEKFMNAYVSRVDFMVDRTEAGQLTVNYLLSSQLNQSYLQESITNQTIIGTCNLDTYPYSASSATAGFPVYVFYNYEDSLERLWHPVYFQAEGEVVSFQITMNDAQMRSVDNRDCDFQMHAMAIYAEPTSSRFQ